MKYLGHVDKEHREQSLKEHLKNVAELAGEFAEAFGKRDWGYCCGMLHDIGKYSEDFQRRIRGEDLKVDHSTAGAKVCLDKGGLYWILSYCIAGHHAGLPNTGTTADPPGAATLYGRNKKKIPDYSAYSREIVIPSLMSEPFALGKDRKDITFSLSMFIRMIYSCLVDADFLDTERFMNHGNVERDSGENFEDLLGKLENSADFLKWQKNQDVDTINGRRAEILNSCLKKGACGRGLFSLTVPTGGGKTTASLAFALRHAVKNHMKHIIYVIPYTNIIKQNAKVFRKFLGPNNVLEDHCHVDYKASEELKPMLLAAENWGKPVIVTTNVQFFESLFSNKPGKCRKLHNMADSVIIFDEAQMLPGDYLRPCVAMMEELVLRYRSSVILCTATQPALGQFFPGELTACELCPRLKEQFVFFKRVTFENIGLISEEELAEKLAAEEQALCIVNTKKRAQSLYKRLKGEGVFHLSTSMCPKHRGQELDKIRQILKLGAKETEGPTKHASSTKCILISTSLVEAGVDLDFQTVFRQMAGLDSLIQAAGRCNREGKRPAKDSKVFIFQMEGKEYTPGQRLQTDVAGSVLGEERKIDSLETVTEYFKRLYHFKGESLDKKNILGQFEHKNFPFLTVAKEVKLIERETKTVYIDYDENAHQLLERLRTESVTRELMRQAGEYCVDVYEDKFNEMYDARMFEPVTEEKDDFYLLKEEKQYTEDMGLNLQVEHAKADFS